MTTPAEMVDRIAALESELERRANIIRATEVERDAGDKVADNLRMALEKAERERDEYFAHIEEMRRMIRAVDVRRDAAEADNAILRAQVAELRGLVDKSNLLLIDLKNGAEAAYDKAAAENAELRQTVDGLAGAIFWLRENSPVDFVGTAGPLDMPICEREQAEWEQVIEAALASARNSQPAAYTQPEP